MRYDALIIGGGPAGLAAAVAAAERGLERVGIIEREAYLGGVLPQCIHDGFGLHLFGRSYTGPEYADIWTERVHKLGIDVLLQTTVLTLEHMPDGSYQLDVVGESLGGRLTLETCSVIVATGCRERTRGQLMIPGTRPAGVLTAGTAQYMVNIKNQLPGDSIVILGSGDIGLIMARRLTLEGAKVKMVLGQEATGLLRNHISCIKDFDIPFRFGWGVVSITGRGQLNGVNIAPLKEDGSFDIAHKTLVRCNVLLIACGLIPEREVLAGVDTDAPGIYVCGNARQPKDLVDEVIKESLVAGAACAEYVSQSSGAMLCKPLPSDLALMASKSISETKGSIADLLEGDTDVLSDEKTSLVVCTLCPTGCLVRVELSGKVRGHSCERGEAFALAEVKCPMRTFTGTVLTGDGQLLSVRSASEVRREQLQKLARTCRRTRVSSGLKKGSSVHLTVDGSPVELMVTSSVG